MLGLGPRSAPPGTSVFWCWETEGSVLGEAGPGKAVGEGIGVGITLGKNSRNCDSNVCASSAEGNSIAHKNFGSLAWAGHAANINLEVMTASACALSHFTI